MTLIACQIEFRRNNRQRKVGGFMDIKLKVNEKKSRATASYSTTT